LIFREQNGERAVYLSEYINPSTDHYRFKDDTMRSHKYPSWPIFSGVLFGLLLTGCATRVGSNIQIPMGELALHDAVPKAQSIAKLERHIGEAKDSNMPFLAPHYYREASDMVRTIQRSKPDNVSTEQLAKADAILDKGEAVMGTVKNRLGKELELKDLLDKLSAEEIYPWRYKMIIHDLSNLIEKVELDRGGNIERDREDLNKSMRELYNKTLEYTSSHGSRLTGKDTKEQVEEK